MIAFCFQGRDAISAIQPGQCCEPFVLNSIPLMTIIIYKELIESIAKDP